MYDLVQDADRFIRYFQVAIETSPLQVYASGLTFAPEKSIVRNLFHDKKYDWICSRPKVQPDWTACLQTLESSVIIESIAFSPKSNLIASSGISNVCIWSAATGELVRQFRHEGHIGSVAFSSDAELLASGSNGCTVRIWSAATGALKQHIPDSGNTNSVTFSPDSKLIASCSDDYKVRIWSVDTGDLRHTLQSNHIVKVIAFSSDSMCLMSGSRSDIQAWSASTGVLQSTTEWTDEYSHITSMAFSSDLYLLALGTYKLVRIISAVTGKSERTFEVPDITELVTFSPDSKAIAASTRGSIRIWSVATGEIHHIFPSNGLFAKAMAFSADANLLAAGSYKNVRIWSTATNELQKNAKLTGYVGRPTSAALSSDLRLLASSSANRIQIRSADTGEALQTLEDNNMVARSMTFSPDSTLLAWTSFNHTWDMKIYSTVKRSFQLIQKNTSVESMTFSPDSKLLAMRLLDKTVRIWSTATGQFQYVPEDDDRLRLLFDNDKTSISGFGTGGNWVTYRGSNVLWLPVDFRPTCAAISGSTIAIGCNSGMSIILRFDPTKL